MKEKPILFNTEMVKAVLAGNKTQTRRVIKNACDIITDWDKNDPSYGPFYEDEFGDSHESIERCPYGKIGDQLWVRETFCIGRVCETDGHPMERTEYVDQCAGDNDILPKEFCLFEDIDISEVIWKPSIFMFRKDSRIQLEITNIRVQRIQDISATDIENEGALTKPTEINDVLPIWIKLWDSINKKRGFGWDKNPWVWVIEFRRVPDDQD